MKSLVLLLFSLVAGCKSASSAPEAEAPPAAISVTCSPARAAGSSQKVALRGVVAAPPDRQASVASVVAGRVVELRVREGERVKAGQLIAVVEDPTLAEAVIEGDATRGSAQAALASADAALARAKRLFDQGIAPRRDVEDAEARRASALADLQAAEARGQLARHQRDRARVTAPIAGVVVRVLRRAGELVDGTAATPLVEIADPTRLELRADVPAAELVRLREGAAAEIHLDAVPGAPLAGTIVFVSPSVDSTTSLGVVRASIAPSTDGTVQPKLGLAGRIEVEVPGRTGVVLVPAVALRRGSAGGEEVVVCDLTAEGGAAASVRPVETGAHPDGDVEIVKGLAVGEQVATRHVVGLEDGAKLEVSGAARPGAKPEAGK